MYWLPGDYTATCHTNPLYTSCSPQVLSFLQLIVQLLGYSFDDYLVNANRKSKTEDYELQYDFIVVGGGAAGCVLANRLSEFENWKILLLEAGDEEPAVASIPSLARILRLSNIDYAYYTQPEFNGYEHVSYFWPRGKVMGGSSTINTMWYVRGHGQDYDDWANLGNPGWSYRDVLPYFMKSEDAKDPKILSESPAVHGSGGYMRVERFPYEDVNTKIIRAAWKELGYTESDYNSGMQYGTSKLQYNVIQGAHQSANSAFLRPVRGSRSNLHVKTNSRVFQVIIDPSTKRATGVKFVTADYKTVSVYAKKEVIISAGSIESPKLLMLSGIGPAQELKDLHIPVVKNAPGVGSNLLDHPILYPFTFKLTKTATLVSANQMQNDLVNWLSSRSGPLSAIGAMDSITYYQNDYQYPGKADIQFGFTGFISEAHKISSDFKFIPSSYYDQARTSLTLLTPKSKGYLTLNRTDPVWGQPMIYSNVLKHPDDMQTIIKGIRYMRKIVHSQVLRANGFVRSMTPEEGCENLPFDSDEYFVCLVRRTAGSAFHLGGTCKMGPSCDPEAVVDARLRVHGISGLRVIDGSIMPTLVRANTYAATIMIAEKGSDMVKEDWLSFGSQKSSSYSCRANAP